MAARNSLIAVVCMVAAMCVPAAARAQPPFQLPGYPQRAAPDYTPPPVPSFSPPAVAPVAPPTPSAPPAAPSLESLGRSLQNYFTEQELRLLFEYMQEAVVAAFKGEEVALAPDLAFKLEVLFVRMQKEGGHYMNQLMQQMERDLRKALKDKGVELAPKPASKPAP